MEVSYRVLLVCVVEALNVKISNRRIVSGEKTVIGITVFVYNKVSV